MTTSKSLPDRPSLESLRKQAKKLGRDIAAGDAGAIARARAQLPDVDLPLTRRNAQLVLAREYGYAGWKELTAEVSKRLGDGLDSAVTQARQAIHNNDVERLKQLLAEYPALLSWHGHDSDNKGGLLGIATGAYGDAGDPERERWFTRAAPAEVLIDAGAIVTPSVCEGLLESRARGLLHLFRDKGLLPRTLKFQSALGDLDAVRIALDENGNDPAAVNEAFICACRFGHESVASLLLERLIALDPTLGRHVDESVGRPAFIQYFIEKRPPHATTLGPWKAFVMEHVTGAIGERDLEGFVRGLRRDPWLLGEALVWFQADLISDAALQGRADFIAALLDLEPAILRYQPPPQSQAIEFALTYRNTHLMPLLTRIWPLPDDLPHAAGMGNLARVKQWFDDSGAPALGDVESHYPNSPYMPKDRVDEYESQWAAPGAQRVLDAALAFSVTNDHFDVADFLLAHGADINTRWNSHEPASILHHLVFYGGYESMQFLIDRGIDMTIRDYRWNSTATGWARHALKDETMARWLEEAERQRG
jgi:hypothetical protein